MEFDDSSFDDPLNETCGKGSGSHANGPGEEKRRQGLLKKITLAYNKREKEVGGDQKGNKKSNAQMIALDIPMTYQRSGRELTRLEDRDQNNVIPEEFDLGDYVPLDERDEIIKGLEKTTGTRSGNDPLKFIIMERPLEDKDGDRDIPDPDDFNDLINTVLQELAEENPDAMKAFQWSDEKRGIVN